MAESAIRGLGLRSSGTDLYTRGFPYPSATTRSMFSSVNLINSTCLSNRGASQVCNSEVRMELCVNNAIHIMGCCISPCQQAQAMTTAGSGSVVVGKTQGG